ncbi:precorrin-2 C(20)-methyltransferase [Kytococcus schroeteri]|uniref:Precorrin-2 C(20)-methyltransferase n=2 Tax=Kytococcus TaxID=57499 RepID=A0A2I1PA26_9MICO|nr:precorrin-2 C(20)-methyltransferase [Kytococcus schroeteri]PKZ41462.1 precorrin-2 C(20)-methyltransferase [Kytococcus schroeteri]
MTAGTLHVVGVGPGDPELVTRRAERLIAAAPVVAYHRAPRRPSTARAIAAGFLGEGVTEEELVYPVTTGPTEDYHQRLAAFYAECAARLGEHLRAGRDVVLLAEGDPLFYGSPMYVRDLLGEEFTVEVVPGVTSPSAATAAVGTGLCRHEDVLTVLPGTLPVAELARRLADTDAAVVMKLGRTFPTVREALREAGVLDRAVYVEHASRGTQRVLPVAEVDPATVPYMALVVVPGQDRRADAAGRAVPQAAPAAGGGGSLHVVGLGPGDDALRTPQADAVLAAATHVIGYAPYLARVPQRDGLVRLPSGNTVEVDRGRQALELAAAGHHVAVVSGGDAGVFGMAAAVFEAREVAAGDADPATAALGAVPVTVVPGVTAAHAASALAGAALGADHALISLSDRLKPLEVVLDRVRACARADLAMAFYNPRSRSRPHQLGEVVAVLREELPGDHVVAVARQVSREGEALEVTDLASFDPEVVDMGCLVLVGARSTRVTADDRVWTPRYVEG